MPYFWGNVFQDVLQMPETRGSTISNIYILLCSYTFMPSIKFTLSARHRLTKIPNNKIEKILF